MRVCIIDDSEPLRRLIAKILERHGFITETYENGADALTHLNKSEELPDVIFVDYLMPEMNGLEFRWSQKISERLRNIPACLMTAFSEGVDLARDCPFDAYLIKPAPAQSILETIDRLIPSIAAVGTQR